MWPFTAIAFIAAVFIAAALAFTTRAGAGTPTSGRRSHATRTAHRVAGHGHRQTKCASGHANRGRTRKSRGSCPSRAGTRSRRRTSKSKPKRRTPSTPKPSAPSTASTPITTTPSPPATTVSSPTTTTAGVTPSPPPVDASTPFLHQRGTEIVDSSGNAVQLRGVNLGGWLSWEGWIWGCGFDSETAIMNGLTSLVGAQAAAQFQQAVYNDFVTEADIREIAQLGFNVIRVPFNYRLLQDPSTPYVYNAAGWQVLDNLIGWAGKYHVYVVLDMQDAPGGQTDSFTADATSASLWSDPDDQAQMVALWRAIAQRYADNPAVAGYDLLNEPWPPGNQPLIALYARTIAAIRQVDTVHMIFLEGGQGSHDFSGFTRPLDPNMVYTSHQYVWAGADVPADLDADVALARSENVALWIGEFGENTPAIDAGELAAFTAQPLVSGWAYWTWKKTPDWAGALEQIEISPAWNQLITWLAFQSTPAPTAAQATAAMQAFLSDIQYANNAPGAQELPVLTAAGG